METFTEPPRKKIHVRLTATISNAVKTTLTVLVNTGFERRVNEVYKYEV